MTTPDEILIITDDECEVCQEVKRILGEQHQVRFLDFAADEAVDLLGQQPEVYVPMAFARFGEAQERCDLARDGDDVVLVCGDKTFPLSVSSPREKGDDPPEVKAP